MAKKQEIKPSKASVLKQERLEHGVLDLVQEDRMILLLASVLRPMEEKYEAFKKECNQQIETLKEIHKEDPEKRKQAVTAFKKKVKPTINALKLPVDRLRTVKDYMTHSSYLDNLLTRIRLLEFSEEIEQNLFNKGKLPRELMELQTNFFMEKYEDIQSINKETKQVMSVLKLEKQECYHQQKNSQQNSDFTEA